jgi:hypothetical protein
LDVVLKPLKEASFKGLALTDPHDDEHWVFPLLYAYVCDHPKGCKVSCLSSCYTCRYIQISSLWKLDFEMNLGFSFTHLNDLWLVCCLWISRLHVPMTQINVNIHAVCASVQSNP